MSKNQDAAAAGAAEAHSKAAQQNTNQQQQQVQGGGTAAAAGGKVGMFHPSSGPADAIKLGPEVPAVGIDRARALRKAWLTQTRQLPPQRPEPDFDELEEAFDDEVPFEPPVHLPNLLLLLLDIWDEEGLLA